jgi:hypothetical protein
MVSAVLLRFAIRCSPVLFGLRRGLAGAAGAAGLANLEPGLAVTATGLRGFSMTVLFAGASGFLSLNRCMDVAFRVW